MDRRQRFLTLEAMRGLAAICVVIMHGREAFGIAAPAGGYLAVDFFFLLSGFIMAHAYEGKLDRGLPKLSFLRARMIRLYPLYLVGTLSTVALAVASIVFRHQNTLWTYTKPLVSLPLAVWLIPNPTADLMFPLNVPAWTLLLELIANLAFAFGAWRRNSALLATVALAALVLIVSAATYGQLNLGWSTASFTPGLGRVFFSFPLGVLLYRIRHQVRLPGMLGVAAPLVLVGLLYADPAGAGRGVFDVLFIAVASPVLLMAAAAREPAGRRLQWVCMTLGVISYPLYVLHHSTLIAAIGVVERSVPPGLAFKAACFAVIAGLMLAAWLAAEIDRRVGMALASRRQRRAAALGMA